MTLFVDKLNFLWYGNPIWGYNGTNNKWSRTRVAYVEDMSRAGRGRRAATVETFHSEENRFQRASFNFLKQLRCFCWLHHPSLPLPHPLPHPLLPLPPTSAPTAPHSDESTNVSHSWIISGRANFISSTQVNVEFNQQHQVRVFGSFITFNYLKEMFLYRALLFVGASGNCKCINQTV